MSFAHDRPGVYIRADEGGLTHQWKMSSHSGYQAAGRFGLPPSWAKQVIAEGFDYQRDALSYAMNEYVRNYDNHDNRFLLRNVDGVNRGFLSTSYKRLNTRDIFLMFLMVAQQNNLPIVGAYEGTSRDYLEVIDPNLIYLETPNNGIVAYANGMQLKNSDFGDGRLELRSFKKNAVCLNGLIGQSFIKEVHLGARLAQEFVYSLETINKDTEVRALMVRDAMNYIFSDRNREFEEAQILEASDQKIELKHEIERLPKLGLGKLEAKAVETVLLNRNEDDGVYGNPSRWMLSQAVSAVARSSNEERMRELQQIAGSLVFKKKVEELEFAE